MKTATMVIKSSIFNNKYSSTEYGVCPTLPNIEQWSKYKLHPWFTTGLSDAKGSFSIRGVPLQREDLN